VTVNKPSSVYGNDLYNRFHVNLIDSRLSTVLLHFCTIYTFISGWHIKYCNAYRKFLRSSLGQREASVNDSLKRSGKEDKITIGKLKE